MMKNMNHKTSAVSKAFDAPISAEEMQRMLGRENREKRTRAGKIFDLGRGLHQAVLFADPVHYHCHSIDILTAQCYNFLIERLQHEQPPHRGALRRRAGIAL